MKQQLDHTPSPSTKVEVIALFWTFLAALPAGFELSREVSAVCLAILVLLPLLSIWLTTSRLVADDPIVLIGIVWILGVSLPVLVPTLYKDPRWYTLSDSSLDLAALWMYRGWVICSLVYWALRSYLKDSPGVQSPISDLLTQQRMRRCMGLTALVGGVMKVIYGRGNLYTFIETSASHDRSSLGQVAHFLDSFSVIYVFIYFSSGGRSRLARLDHWLLVLVISLQSIIFIGAGSKAVALALGSAWVMGRAAAGLRLGFLRELRVVLIGLATVYIVSYIVTAYREEVRAHPPLSHTSVTEALSFQVQTMWSAINTLLDGKRLGTDENQYGTSDMLDRFAHVASFAHVLDTLGNTSPRENAFSSLMVPLLAVLPRDMIPNKVHFADSADFARLCGWSYGGLSITLPGSFFWAWDFGGIIIGMGFIGAMMALGSLSVAGGDSRSLIIRAVVCSAVLGLLDLGETFQTIGTSATRVWIFLQMLRFLVHTRNRSCPTSSTLNAPTLR
ncbi:MAG: hypothetical protein JNN07_28035 [Verrucomicrobiales bacterium]|nr:hypothetical protein [Verrucomicrobiales bacterium]